MWRQNEVDHKRVGLLDVDGHNFPNLALMKISTYHKKEGDIVSWVNFFETYDVVYQSKVFTFTPDNGFIINSNEIIKGGTGYDCRIVLPHDIDSARPDYSIYPRYESAYGFLTRGCPNKCPWCIVPQKEGDIKPYADIYDILQGRKTAILMDNNVLASDWGIKQIEKISKSSIKVDFNQGLDARIIAKDEGIAKLLGRIKWLSPLRLACDTQSQMPFIERAVALLREYNATPRAYFVYVLVKYIEDALIRVEFLRKLKCDPFAQPYIDFSDKGSVTKEQKKFARWVNHKAIFKSVKWKDYK